jgi:hypothetical protein
MLAPPSSQKSRKRVVSALRGSIRSATTAAACGLAAARDSPTATVDMLNSVTST